MKTIDLKYLGAGSVADLHLGFIPDGKLRRPSIVKQAKIAADNDLIDIEHGALLLMAGKVRGSVWESAIPKVYGTGVSEDGRNYLELEYFAGYFTCEQIKEMVPEVDPKDIVWMWKRLMGLLSWAISARVVHGAILPPHVMYFPDNSKRLRYESYTHSVRVVDWCYAIEWDPSHDNNALNAWCPEWEDFYPPEVKQKRGVTPLTDVYMAAKLMSYLAGGYSKLPMHLREVYDRCVQRSPYSRPNSPVAVMELVTEAASKDFGEPEFHEFLLPGI